MAISPPGRFDAAGLRLARENAGLTQAALAECIGANPAIVNLWETRGVCPTVRNLALLAEALGLAVGDLYESDTTTAGSLADLRVGAGLSQLDLAKQVGVSQTLVSRWERAKARPTWEEITRYASALGLARKRVALAVDTTAAQHGNPPIPQKPLRSKDFQFVGSSPHVIYEFEDPNSFVTVTSPQFPRLRFQTKSPTPTMLELATLNEHLEADYRHRYNHLQHRCRGAAPDDPVYLIRWLSALHESTRTPTHSRSRAAASLALAASLWRSGHARGPQQPLSSGEYLVVVVEPDDNTTFLFNQITPGEPVTFYPTTTDNLGSLTICLNSDAPACDRWAGAIDRTDIPDDMTYAELFTHLQPRCPTSVTAVTTGAKRSRTDTAIERRFSKKTPYDSARR